MNAGYGMIVETDAGTDTMTLRVDQNIDIIGSVFSDDSTKLVDGVEAEIVGTVNTLNVTASSVLSGAGTGIINNFVSATIGTVNGNLVGNSTGYHTGDVTGSVFADDSTKIVDAVENQVYASGGIFGDLTGNVTGNVTGDTAGTHTGNVVGNVTGDLTGYQTGDMTGSVFGDDSNKLVDAVEGKIVGDIDVAGTAAFNVSNVPSDSTGASGDKQGMVAFDATSVYFCIADWASPGTANIWVKQDWSTTGAW